MRLLFVGLLASALVLGLAALWFAIEPAPIAAASSGEMGESARGAAHDLIASDAPARERAPARPIDGTNASASETASDASTLVHGGAPRMHVVGRVVDPDGRAVAGATVLGSTQLGLPLPIDLESDVLPKGWIDRVATTSDERGRFALELPEPGELVLGVRAHGFAPRDLTLPELVDAPLDVGDVALSLGVTLNGVVVDARGAPVAHANVYRTLSDDGTHGDVSIQGLGVLLAQTGDDGGFVVDVLAHGPWRLFVDSGAHLVSEAAGRTERPGERVDGLRIVLRDGGEISGRVESSTIPAGGYELRAGPMPESGGRGVDAVSAASGDRGIAGGSARARRARMQDDGSFVLRGVEPEKPYRISVWEPPSASRPARMVPRFDPVVATAGERGKVLRERAQTTIVLRAVDARTNAPIEELVAWAGIGRERVVSDVDGRQRHHFDGGIVQTTDLRPPPNGGALWLRLRAPGYVELKRRDLEVTVGRTSDLGVLRLEPEPALRVRVVDSASGAPVPSASVFVGEASPEELGDYRDADLDQDFYGDRVVAFARTDDTGVARVAGGAGRTVDVRANARGYLSSVQRIAVPISGDDASVELRMARGGRVEVRVRDDAGVPVPSIGIVHRERARAPSADGEGDDESPERATDALGAARFLSLPPGAHEFRLQGDARDWRAVTLVEGGDATIDFVVRARGVLEGRVREDGTPLAGAVLRIVADGESESAALEGRRAVSDLEGRFEIEGLAPGPHVLWIGHRSRAMATRVAVQMEAPRTSCNVDLPAASIEGRVLDPDGRPLAAVRVHVDALDADGGDGDDPALFQTLLTADENGSARVRHRAIGDARTETGADGRYRLRGVVASARLQVRVERDDLESASSPELVLTDDEARSGVDFVLRGAGSIEIAIGASARPANDAFAPRRSSPDGSDPDALSIRIVRVGGDGPVQERSMHWNGWQRRQLVRSLLPGAYDVRLVREANPADVISEQRVSVTVGETTKVALAAP